jgi:bloom syndrome protein
LAYTALKKSFPQLETLLARNLEARRQNSLSIKDYDETTQADIVVLKAIECVSGVHFIRDRRVDFIVHSSILEDRIQAIEDEMASKSAMPSTEPDAFVDGAIPASSPSLGFISPDFRSTSSPSSSSNPSENSQEISFSSDDLFDELVEVKEPLEASSSSEDELWGTMPDVPTEAWSTSPPPGEAQPLSPEHYNELLKRVFRLDRFRENQLDIIAETVAGRDTVVLMSTGAGKSLCFQLPAVYESERNGRVTIVVSPLVALIRDQVDALKAKGVHAIGLTPDNQEWLPVSKPALVYVTPEKLCKSSFLRDALSHLYRDGNLARFAIDEAHCISTWGHDFRDSVSTNIFRLYSFLIIISIEDSTLFARTSRMCPSWL